MTKQKRPEDKLPRGRPSNFNETLAARLIELAKEGYTDEQMANAAGVSVQCFNVWKTRYPNFLEALKEAKSVADEFVEVSLYRRACGYSHKELRLFCHEGAVIEHDTVKHYPPDVTACIFWLKNRQPAKWRDVSVIVSDKHDEELDKVPKENVLELLRDLRGPKVG